MFFRNPLIMLGRSRLAVLLALVLGGWLSLGAGPAQGSGPGGSPGNNSAAPILTITSYHTTPSPVASGQAFDLTVTVQNTGSKHADDIVASVAAGGGFVGLGAPVLVGKLDPGMSATFTVRAQAGSLSSGAHTLALQFSFHIGESGEQSVTRELGVQVQGTASAPGEPQLVIDSVEVLSPPSAVGEAFEVSVVIRNAGQRKAFGASAAFVPNDYTSPAQGSGIAQLGDLAAGQTATITQTLVLDQASPTGRIAQTFRLDYRDASENEHSTEQTANLNVGTAARQSPQLIISGYSTTPERPSPGDTFTLTLEVTNVGTAPARQVLVRLGTGEAGLGPFVPLGTSNVGFAGSIAPGAKAAFQVVLMMRADAEGGGYTLGAEITYQDRLGETLTESELVGLLTVTRPQLQIDLTRPLPANARVGDSFEIAVEIINIGRQRLDVTTLEVAAEGLDLERNSIYVGPLDASISGGLTAQATARSAGQITIRILVHYRDDLNQMQTIEETMVLDVSEGAAAPLPQGASQGAPSASRPGFWALLAQFLGLGG